ncbi:MAG TPA: LLM class flavin-dependent oxidoreductase, partial [Methylomirabilota bacterium]
MKIGIMIEGQEGLTWERWFRLADAAESLGYESLCRSDHLTGLGGESGRPSLETWTSLTALATRTRRIRFGPMVSPLTFYHPAILAKMAAAVDTLSGGRLDLGLGAGWNEHEHKMFGVPFPTVKERLDRLEAGARLIRSLEKGQPVTLKQPLFPLEKAESFPLPKNGRYRIVIGGRGEKRTLKIVAEFADEWNVTRVDIP